MPTLIVYASAQGSTAEIAQRIDEILKSKGIDTEISSVDHVSDLARYSSVILGSAVINFQWLEPAQLFLRRNSEALSKIPVWAFSVGCPTTLPGRVVKALGAENEDEQLEEWIKQHVAIREHILFHGRFLKSHFSISNRILWRVIGGRYGDFRDWQEVEKWAGRIAENMDRPNNLGVA
jgi:menaquinone-dependent protoporphyrinogen oxidase